MKRLATLALAITSLTTTPLYAVPATSASSAATDRAPITFIQPSPPAVDAKAYILVDAASGQVLAQRDADERLPPASLTKLMTCYVLFSALKAGTTTVRA